MSRVVSGSATWRKIDRIMRDIWPRFDQSDGGRKPLGLIDAVAGIELQDRRVEAFEV
jgi:hypothetical protein